MAPQTVFGITLDIEALTGRQKLLIAGVGAALIVGLGVYVGMEPYNQWQEAKERVEKLVTEKETKEGKVKRIPELKKKFEALQSEIRGVEERLPREANIPSLLTDVERLGLETKTPVGSVVLDKFVPQSLADLTLPSHLQDAAGEIQSVKQLPMDVVVRGQFPSIIALLKSFEGYERTLSTVGLVFRPIRGRGDDPRVVPIQVDLKLNAFVLLEKGGP